MRDAITRTRMQRIENLFVGLPRMVRDLSAELGKQVLVDIEGGDVELDREMIEMIRDPLTHIIRNAVDHGIETPAERLKAGKREIGILCVSARQSGNQILIDIHDDGRGIDGKKLVEKAISRGDRRQGGAAQLAPREQLALIFEAGLSTAKRSHRDFRARRRHGRGPLQHRADRRHRRGRQQARRGHADDPSRAADPDHHPGADGVDRRTSISQFRARRSRRSFAPTANRVTLEHLGGAGVATIRGRRVPEVSLAEILGLDSQVDEPDRTLIVLRPAGGDVYALAVDRIHDHEELVVKPAAPAVMATGLYAGTTLADDGSPILLFDAGGLGAGRRSQARGAGARGARSPKAPQRRYQRRRRCCCFGASTAAAGRSASRSSIGSKKCRPSAIRQAAGQLRVQVGEAILPLAGAELEELGDDKVRLFRLNDGAHEIGYAFAEVLDFAAIENDVIHADKPGEVSGVSLINGEPAELVDAHWLFATHVGAAASATEQLVCRLPSDDPWMQHMLRPMVEAAGYRVVGDDDEPWPIWSSPPREPSLATRLARRPFGCAPTLKRQARRTTASTDTTARAC